MTIIIAVNDDRIGVIQQGAPAEDRDIDLALERSGEWLEPSAFEQHRTHVRMLVEEFDGDRKEFHF